MFDDVPDDVFWPHSHEEDFDVEAQSTTFSSNSNRVMSRVKNVTSTLGSFITSNPTYKSALQTATGFYTRQRTNQGYDTPDPDETASSQMETRSYSPSMLSPSLPQTPQLMTDVKRIFTNVAKTRTAPNFASVRSRTSTRQSTSSIYSNSITEAESTGTPPLTPDSANDPLPSPLVSLDFLDNGGGATSRPRSSSLQSHGIVINDVESPRLECSSAGYVKEGKKRAKPICYDTLIADISPVLPPVVQQPEDDWYGLEYVLELSRKEDGHGHATAEIQSPSFGENSKSRESWEAIHRGRVHPQFEEQQYRHWRRWRAHLDRQDARKRMKIALAFLRDTDAGARYYVDQVHALGMLEWLKERGENEGLKQLEGHLKALSLKRPDPFHHRHLQSNTVHAVQRNRSIGCLRDLALTRALICNCDEDETVTRTRRYTL